MIVYTNNENMCVLVRVLKTRFVCGIEIGVIAADSSA